MNHSVGHLPIAGVRPRTLCHFRCKSECFCSKIIKNQYFSYQKKKNWIKHMIIRLPDELFWSICVSPYITDHSSLVELRFTILIHSAALDRESFYFMCIKIDQQNFMDYNFTCKKITFGGQRFCDVLWTQNLARIKFSK